MMRKKKMCRNQLIEEAKSSCDLEKEPLNFSLGSLFTNLDFHIA